MWKNSRYIKNETFDQTEHTIFISIKGPYIGLSKKIGMVNKDINCKPGPSMFLLVTGLHIKRIQNCFNTLHHIGNTASTLSLPAALRA